MVTHWSRCKAKALVDTLSDRLEEKNVEALRNTLTQVKAEALLDRIADKVAEKRLPTFRDRMSVVRSRWTTQCLTDKQSWSRNKDLEASASIFQIGHVLGCNRVN